MINLSVVIPVYNEGQSIPALQNHLVNALEHLARDWEIVFVNDGSNDGSAQILNKIASADPRIKIVHLRRNFGQTAAIMAGIDYSRGEIIVTMDSDLQNDPNDIPALLTKLEEGYDVVSGWREHRKDAE